MMIPSSPAARSSRQRRQNHQQQLKVSLRCMELTLVFFLICLFTIQVYVSVVVSDDDINSSIGLPSISGKNAERIRRKDFAQQKSKPSSDRISPTENELNFVNVTASLQSLDAPLLPTWITKYMAWHRQVRKQWPGLSLFRDAEAPNVLVRVCLGLCGGLNDRIGQLPWDLYLANQTQRVYFIQWSRPRGIENFLLPNIDVDGTGVGFNWSLPHDLEGFQTMRQVRAQPEFFDPIMVDSSPESEHFQPGHALDQAIQRATTGEYRTIKILRHRLLGHLYEDELEQRLIALGETDTIHTTATFGRLFWTVFQPSRAVQMEVNKVYHDLNMVPGHYSVVHCRVRHPKAHPPNAVVHGKNANYPADKTGLPWVGDTRDFAISIATHAIQCAQTLREQQQQQHDDGNHNMSNTNDEPLYFMSDSTDLVQYMAMDIGRDDFWNSNVTLRANPVDRKARALMKIGHHHHQSKNGTSNPPPPPVAMRSRRIPAVVVARSDTATVENAHIDRQKGRDPPAYFATFVDLILASQARCVVFGIGFYAILAAKISHTSCKLNYQEETWGGSIAKSAMAPFCSADMVSQYYNNN